MKPQLIILNGPCGIGKNTIANLYASGNKSSVVLDIDDFRRGISSYRQKVEESYKEACNLVFIKTEEYLLKKYDVIIPNLIRKLEVIESFEKIANKCNGEFYEFSLWASKEDAISRAVKRGFQPDSLLQEDKLIQMYDELEEMLKNRKNTVFINSEEGNAEKVYNQLIKLLNK